MVVSRIIRMSLASHYCGFSRFGTYEGVEFDPDRYIQELASVKVNFFTSICAGYFTHPTYQSGDSLPDESYGSTIILAPSTWHA
jgi:hypothetical protein